MNTETVKPCVFIPSDPRIVGDLRTDHAGETGAVWIYLGVLAVTRDDEVRAFAHEHLQTEKRHLCEIEAALGPPQRSILIPLWKLAGWLTGALPALFGPRAVYATVEAVETFVDAHYQEQIDRLAADPRQASLRDLLRRCQLDEIHHRNDARARRDAPNGIALAAWARMVAAGSKAAVAVSRRV